MFQRAEFNIEMVIYVILMVIYILYYLLKKKPVQQNQRTEPIPYEPYEDDFDEESEIDPFEEIRRKVLSIPQEPKPQPEYTQTYNESNKKEVYSKMKVDKMQTSHQRKPKKEALKVIELEDDDNAQKILGVEAPTAIIISEILKRPEY